MLREFTDEIKRLKAQLAVRFTCIEGTSMHARHPVPPGATRYVQYAPTLPAALGSARIVNPYISLSTCMHVIPALAQKPSNGGNE